MCEKDKLRHHLSHNVKLIFDLFTHTHVYIISLFYLKTYSAVVVNIERLYERSLIHNSAFFSGKISPVSQMMT